MGFLSILYLFILRQCAGKLTVLKDSEKYKKTEAELWAREPKDAIDAVLELRQGLAGAQSAGQLPIGQIT